MQCYIVLEQYAFSPADVFAQVTIKEYLTFLIYSLEYRAMVMEQMSHEREQLYLKEHPNVNDQEDGYGVVLLFFAIRDLNGKSKHLLSSTRMLYYGFKYCFQSYRRGSFTFNRERQSFD